VAAADFERVTGYKATIDYANIAIARRCIGAGEPFDVVVVSPKAIEDLVREGTIAAGDPLNLGRTGLALFGHKGAARPDIGTEEALKRTLLSARLVAYSDTGESGIGFVKVLDSRTGRGRGRLRRPARQRGDGSWPRLSEIARLCGRVRPSVRMAVRVAALVDGGHWITASASSSRSSGSLAPSAAAAFWLITSSKRVGNSIGSSPGFAPLRIMSTYRAARRSSSGMSMP